MIGSSSSWNHENNWSHAVAVLVFLNMFLNANDSMKISRCSSKNTWESFSTLFLELLAAICANTILKKYTLGGPSIFFFGKLGKISLGIWIISAVFIKDNQVPPKVPSKDNQVPPFHPASNQIISWNLVNW